MIVSDEKNFIFIAVPKTGSSSIEQALYKYSNEPFKQGLTKHTIFSDVPGVLNEKYYKFCFFRNPWDRFVSMFHYHQRQKSKFLSRDYENVEFDDWLKKSVIGGLGGLFRKQTDFIMRKGRPLPDIAVYKFEEMEDSWKHICKKLDIDIELPHINITKHKHYSEYYTDETEHLVRIFDYGTIRMMNYEFEKI